LIKPPLCDASSDNEIDEADASDDLPNTSVPPEVAASNDIIAQEKSDVTDDETTEETSDDIADVVVEEVIETLLEGKKMNA
jgi:hypothetical protein